MELLAANVTQAMADLLLPFMRVSGLFAAMVGVSAKSVPPQVRALLTLFLSVLIMPVVPAVPVDNLVSAGTWVLMIEQLLIGLAAGFVTMMVLNTFVLAGQIVAMQTGLGFASIVDPVNGINVPAVGQFYLILATLLFWGFDGHLAMIRMIVLSFEALPVGQGLFEVSNFKALAHWGSWMFIAAVTLSLAPIVSLLIINLAFGVMTKAAPQLNIFTLGFAIAQIVGLLVIWLTMGNFANHFENQWQRGQQLICTMLQICT